MIRNLRVSIALAFIFLIPVSLFSQTDTIRQKKSKQIWQDVKEHVKLGGWIDGRYVFEADNGGKKSSVMQVQRARIDLQGNLSRWVDFRLQGEFAQTPKLIDAFVKINFCKYVQLQVGQFRIPFSLEHILSPLDLEFTDNAQGISALAGFNDISGVSSYANGREVGLMLTGTLASATLREENVPILKYSVALLGGNGINVKTDNLAKDLSARIEFCPFVKYLTLSASGYWGMYDMKLFGASTGIDGRRFRYAAGAQYFDKKLMVRSEYVRGLTDLAAPNFYDPEDVLKQTVNTQGFYVLAGYWFNFGWSKNGTVRQKLRPSLRFDYYEKNIADADPSLYYTAALDWWPEKHLRFQLNYTLKQRQNSNYLAHNITSMITVKF